MAYLVYCRDNPDAAGRRAEMLEEHRAFLDGYADALIAGGQTLTDDGQVVTGSLHLVDLPDSEVAHDFARTAPNYRAGIYREVLVRHWHNLLARTTWAKARFLVIGHAGPGMTATHDALAEHDERYFVEHGYQARFIALGPMVSDDGSEWLGGVMLVDLPERAEVETMLAGEPYLRCGLYAEIEIHRWRSDGDA